MYSAINEEKGYEIVRKIRQRIRFVKEKTLKHRGQVVGMMAALMVAALMNHGTTVMSAGVAGTTALQYIDCNQFEEDEDYTNYFVVGFSKNMKNAKNLTMEYINEDRSYVTKKANVEDENVVFFLQNTPGTYKIRIISYEMDGKQYRIDVTKEAKDCENVVDTFTIVGNEMESKTTKDQAQALADYLTPTVSNNARITYEGETRLICEMIKRGTTNGKIAIMLDPGHGGNSGANRTIGGKKCFEDSFVLEIAKYCKAELQKYNNTLVYMTRTTNDFLPLSERTQKAVKAGAKLLVSFHLNATGTSETDANGTEVIYQNGNYRSEVGAKSKKLAQSLLDNMLKLGSKSRGIYYKNSASERYPDGSVADNFAINRDCKKAGIPGVIMEHCFLNNPKDYAKFLSTKSAMNKVGIADATAIAQYLGLNRMNGELAVPENVSVTPTSGNGLRISFSYSGKMSPDCFYIYRATEENGNYVKIGEVDASKTYFKDFGCARGMKHYYKVCAAVKFVDSDWCSDMSESVSYFMLTTPTISELSQKAEKTVYLKWAGIKGADGYEISRASEIDGKFTVIDSVTTKEYTDTSELAETSYYRVRAYHMEGETKYVSIYSIVRFPGTASVEAHRVANNAIMLSWDKVEKAQGYNIYRKAEDEKSYVLVGKADANALSYVDKTVVSSKKYTYRVCNYVKNAAGKEYEGSPANVTVEGCLEAPKITKARPDASGHMALSWSKVEGAQGYYIYRLPSNETVRKDSYRIKTVGESEISFNDTTAKANTAYNYEVVAYKKSDGKELLSVDRNLTLSGTSIKGGVTYSEKSFLLNFAAVDGVDAYQIYRATSKTGKKTLIATIDGKTTKYEDKTVAQGTSYYYWIYTNKTVKMFDEVSQKTVTRTLVGKSGYKSVGKLVVAPTLVAAVVNDLHKVTVKWKPMSGVKSYQIYRNTTGTGKFKLLTEIKDAAVSSFEDTSVESRQLYYYKIRAVVEKNGIAGRTGFSQISCSSIEILEAFPIATKQIRITWTATKVFSGVSIYRKKADGKEDYKLLKSVLASRGKYIDENASTGVLYQYKIVPYYKDGSKKVSGAEVLLKAATLSKPEAVVAKHATNSVKLSWKQQFGANGYVVYRSESNKSGTYRSIATVKGADVTSYTDNTVASNQLYYYKVRAFVTNGKETTYSSYGKVGICGVPACRLQAISSSTVEISWDILKGAKTYELLVKRPGKTGYESLGKFTREESSCRDTNLTAGAKYEYRMRVSDGTYESELNATYDFTLIEKATNPSCSVVGKYTGITVRWSAVAQASGYEIYRYEGDSEEKELIKVCQGKDIESYKDTTVKPNQEYTYCIRAIGDVAGIAQYASYSDKVTGKLTLTAIMGKSKATKEQIIAFYKQSGKSFPSIYAKEEYGGVDSIEDFVTIIIEEASAEGVRAEMLASQIFLETGYLQFGGDVKASQCNFGGIGAVGGGAKGATFPDVRTGIRAQVQHLKAYADEKATLVYECVDPRFQYVTKGCAKYVQWLGISENPDGKGWATAKKYGVSIVSMMSAMRKL